MFGSVSQIFVCFLWALHPTHPLRHIPEGGRSNNFQCDDGRRVFLKIGLFFVWDRVLQQHCEQPEALSSKLRLKAHGATVPAILSHLRV